MSGHHTFLIVDDSEDNRILTAYKLRKAFGDARIAEAEQIDTALQLAREFKPDAILTDHHLGTREGVWFMRELEAAGVHCPVLMITASSDPAIHRRAYNAGAAHVFADKDTDFITFLRRQFATT